MTERIRTLIADDEVLARRTLRDLLTGAGDIELVAECRDGLETAAAIDRLAPELAFLDIQMPGLDGFGAVLRATAQPALVFVTAHERHAVRAFDADAVDYLVKPFDDERFERALARARVEIQRRRLVTLATRLATPPVAARPAPSRLIVKDGTDVELVDVADIQCIRADGYYAELVLSGRTVLMREPLQDLEARLDPARFVRIHRSVIVNVDRIRRVERDGPGGLTLVLEDGARLPVSRSRRGEIDRLLRGR